MTLEKQIIGIRNTGLTNMFILENVKELDIRFRFKELVELIDKNPDSYISFIMTGRFSE